MARSSGPKPTTPRAWQRMLSGRRLDLLDPSPLDIELEDIAHGLARVMRWNGQTKGPQAFSVAQHSLLVERLCVHWRPGWPASYRMAALLHDAPEYVIGDLISPFKAAIGADYKSLENRLLAAIHLRFGLPLTLPTAISNTIKRADIAAAYIEAVQLAGFDESEAKRIFGHPRDLPDVKLKGREPDEASQKFVRRMQKHMRDHAKQSGSKPR
ncbi:HD family hydrolase [Alphaproteobacteria bacterium]|nr:HD family hydrolase [Alphaproteobacteria bacterium]